MAISCVALGTGGATAIFTAANAVLLEPLPFDRPHELVVIWATSDAPGAGGVEYLLSPEQFETLAIESGALAAVGAARERAVAIGREESLEQVAGAEVSPALANVLTIVPLAGRWFDVSEDEAASPVTVVSEGFARTRFGGVAEALTSRIDIGGVPHRVIGVVAEPAYPRNIDIWLTGVGAATEEAVRRRGTLTVVARLKSAVTAPTLAEDLERVAGTLRANGGTNTDLGFGFESLHANLAGDFRGAIALIGIGVSFLYGIAVVNVVSLLLVRFQERWSPLAVRQALGATTRRLLAGIGLETSLLVMIGAVIGLGLTALLLPALVALAPPNLVSYGGVGLGIRSWAFAACSALVTAGVLTGALGGYALRLRPTQGIAEGSVRTGPSRAAFRRLTMLITAEIAAVVVLGAGAGLLLRTWGNLNAGSHGFDPAGLSVVRASAPGSTAGTHAGRVMFFQQVLDGVRTIPGVEIAAATHSLPARDPIYGFGFNVEGQPPAEAGHRERAIYRLVTPGYFRTMRTAILAGREFDQRDRFDGVPVAIVSRAFARHYWPGENPLGKRIKYGVYADMVDGWRTVVGVVDDVADAGLREERRPALYVPHAQFSRTYAAQMSLVVRAAGGTGTISLPSVVDAIKSVDASALVQGQSTMADILRQAISLDRFNMVLAVVFGTASLLLALAGVFGVMSNSVRQQRRSIWIKLAFGASRQTVQGEVVRHALVAGVGGVAAGLLLTWMSSRYMASLLYDIEPLDPATLVATTGAVLIATVVAAVVPAWRAGREDAANILRNA